ncbi:hypothetical protein [Roseiconus lacunae]|uniref:hypothetical protein n=1 Tax=Roseiconus lacunae TaxID=2605694 RepID=UPI001E33BD47|nr:hypothetical protein [Roseiconus lacunae]MCD0458820.1 hypothetical protein [Roseiconus lacunae]
MYSTIKVDRSIVTLGMLLMGLVTPVLSQAQQASHARVSPVLEIEVIDPGVDARGNPAVLLESDGEGLLVDIPPTVLVHRYYYTGDREFQGPRLPGGPSIVVANHPKTGERVYVSVQMLPGAPLVRYTHRLIEYDYGDRGLSVIFTKDGGTCTKVRNGRKLTEKFSQALHLDDLKGIKDDLTPPRVPYTERLAISAKASLLRIEEVAAPITQPAKHMFRLIPGAVALTDPQTEIENARLVYQHQAEKERQRKDFQTRLDNIDQRTLR